VQGIELGHRPEAQIDLFAPQHDHPLVTALQGVDPDNLTPRQALELVYKLKEMAR
jgi:DNA mismatch repair protein MutS